MSALSLPPIWALPLFATAGKRQRDPANGKRKRKSDGKRLRNTATDTACCCAQICGRPATCGRTGPGGYFPSYYKLLVGSDLISNGLCSNGTAPFADGSGMTLTNTYGVPASLYQAAGFYLPFVAGGAQSAFPGAAPYWSVYLCNAGLLDQFYNYQHGSCAFPLSPWTNRDTYLWFGIQAIYNPATTVTHITTYLSLLLAGDSPAYTVDFGGTGYGHPSSHWVMYSSSETDPSSSFAGAPSTQSVTQPNGAAGVCGASGHVTTIPCELL